MNIRRMTIMVDNVLKRQRLETRSPIHGRKNRRINNLTILQRDPRVCVGRNAYRVAVFIAINPVPRTKIPF